MGIRITNGDWGVPGLASPDKQHLHLPFWYDLKIENTPPSPLEAWMQLGMFWMMPFAPRKDLAAEWRADLQRASEFIARRTGLKMGSNFKLMQKGEHGLRYAFATLGGMHRLNAGMGRLHHGNTPPASNDPDKDAPVSTLSLLPNAAIPREPDYAKFTPTSVGTLKTFAVKGLRAANNRHAKPKAPVLAIKP